MEASEPSMASLGPNNTITLVLRPNSTDLGVEEESEKFLKFLVEGVILTIVSVFGLVGNLMSILVLIRVRYVPRSFSNLLLGLACFDALFLLTAILAFGLPHLSDWYEKQVFMPIMAITFGLLHTFRVGSVYVTLSVNFERFHAIVFPFKHFSWKKYLLPAAVLFTFVYNLPKYFEMTTVFNREKNESEIITTDLRRHPLYISIYVFWSKFILVELIPYFTIMICNTFIICKITKSAKFRKKFHKNEEEPSATSPTRPKKDEPQDQAEENSISRSSFHHSSTREPPNHVPRRTFFSKQKEEHNLGVILIAMSTLFIICQSFKIVPDLYELIWCKAGQECNLDSFTLSVMRFSHLLVCINSSANFLIYLLRGQKFREAWLATYRFSWSPCSDEPPNVSSNQHQQLLKVPGSAKGHSVSLSHRSAGRMSSKLPTSPKSLDACMSFAASSPYQFHDAEAPRELPFGPRKLSGGTTLDTVPQEGDKSLSSSSRLKCTKNLLKVSIKRDRDSKASGMDLKTQAEMYA